MDTQILGYGARKSKDGTKSYVTVYLLEEIKADGAGVRGVKIPADSSLEQTLRGMTYPAQASLGYRFDTVNTDFGERTVPTIVSVTPARRAA